MKEQSEESLSLENLFGNASDAIGVSAPVDVHEVELVTFLRGVQLFAGVTDDGMKAIAPRMTVARFDAGTLVCREGDPGDEMFILMCGSVRLLVKERELHLPYRLSKGDFFGEIALLDGGPRTATVVTDVETVVIRYSVDAYTRTFYEDARTGMTLINNIAQIQRERIEATNRENIKQAEERVSAETKIDHVRKVQNYSRPKELPRFGNCEIDVTYEAAASDGISGDFYDFIELPNDPNRLIVLFGDAMSHGFEPGLVVLLAKSASFTQARVQPSVGAITATINEMICRFFRQENLMTFICALLDREKKSIHYVNAGHQAHPYLYHVDTDEFVALEAQTYQLGTESNVTYTESELRWVPGDMLICYTDGFSEAPYYPGGEHEPDRSVLFGTDRVTDLVRRERHKGLHEIAMALREETRVFSRFFDTDAVVGKIEPYGDDTTTLFIRLD